MQNDNRIALKKCKNHSFFALIIEIVASQVEKQGQRQNPQISPLYTFILTFQSNLIKGRLYIFLMIVIFLIISVR